MQFTLYDYLIIYQYKIIEAIKNGFPSDSDYNNWIHKEILSPLLEYTENEGWGEEAIFYPGVYQLGEYYIGKTTKPIIIRIINHLFETIPTIKTDTTMQNTDKILCTKIDLLLNKKVTFDVLSRNPEDEEDIIKHHSKEDYTDFFMVNKIHNRNRNTYSDYFKYELQMNGYSQDYGSLKLFKNHLENRGLHKYVDELGSYYEAGLNFEKMESLL